MPSTGKHYTIEPLTEGVYAALAKRGGVAVSNAGIIDLGERTLVLDTSVSPQAAHELVAHAVALTGRRPALVVNSHWHGDHVMGNSAMPPNTAIISTATTRALMATKLPGWVAERRDRVPRTVQDLEAQYRTATEPDQRAELNEALVYYRQVLEDVPGYALRLPTLTFEQHMTLHGSARVAEVLSFAGHTASDAILWLPDDQIVFAADLLFHQVHPWLGDGDPDAWLQALNAIQALEPEPLVVVPGHGSVTTPDAFAYIRRYIPALRTLAAEIIERGGSPEAAAHIDIPAAFATWDGEPQFANNMRWLHKQLAEQQRAVTSD